MTTTGTTTKTSPIKERIKTTTTILMRTGPQLVKALAIWHYCRQMRWTLSQRTRTSHLIIRCARECPPTVTTNCECGLATRTTIS